MENHNINSKFFLSEDYELISMSKVKRFILHSNYIAAVLDIRPPEDMDEVIKFDLPCYREWETIERFNTEEEAQEGYKHFITKLDNLGLLW